MSIVCGAGCRRLGLTIGYSGRAGAVGIEEGADRLAAGTWRMCLGQSEVEVS